MDSRSVGSRITGAINNLPILRTVADAQSDMLKLLADNFELSTANIDEVVEAIQRLCSPAAPKLVVTPNVDQLLNLRVSKTLRDAYAYADLRLIDGMPIVLVARLLGVPEVSRVTGSDLLERTVAVSASNDLRIAIVGGDDKFSEDLKYTIDRRYKGAYVTAVHLPYIDEIADTRCLSAIDQLQNINPDLVFLCLGSPKQEAWFMQWRATIPPAVYIGAGAAGDFLVGNAVRAPRVIQRIGMEWVWRLMREPKRLARRYLGRGPLFLIVMFKSLRGRWRR